MLAASLVRMPAIALVVALPLLVNPFGPDAYAGIKAEVLYGLTALMLVAWAAAAALRAAAAWRVSGPELAVWVFWLAVLLSSITSVNLRLTILGAPGRSEGILAVTAYLALFFIAAQYFGSRPGLRRLMTAAGVGAGFAIAYGFAQLGLPPLFDGEAMIRSWYGATGLHRIFSTLGSPIVFGGYLTVVVPLALALAISPHPDPLPQAGEGTASPGSPSPPPGGEGRVRARITVLWLSVAVAGSVATVFTYTRAAWIALAAATVVFFVLAGKLVWRQHRRALVLGAAAAVVIAAVLLAMLGGPAPAVERAATALTLETGSAGQRIYIWRHTVQLIRQRPVLGWGLETLREVFPYDRPSLERHFGRRPVIIDKAHNDLLQVAVSVGVPGALAYLAVWVLVLRAAYRMWRHTGGGQRVLAAGLLAAFAAYLIQAQFSFSTVPLAPLVWLLAGATSGWEASVSTSIPASLRASSRRPISAG